MNDLLKLAIKGHGGARRCEQISRFRASASITGAIWSLKGEPGLLGSVLLEGETRDQRVKMTPFRGPASTPPGRRTGRRSRPPRVCWWPGASTRRRRSPGSPGCRPGTTSRSPTSPARPAGTTSPPRSSWPVRTSWVRRPSLGTRTDRCGATWWSLPGRDRGAHRPADLILRRRRRAVAARLCRGHLGGGPAMHYPSQYREFGGIMIPARRRVYVRNPDGTPVRDSVWIAIDIANVTFS